MAAPSQPRPAPDLDAWVRAVVDRAPPLTADQRARLAVLLAPPPAPVRRAS